MLNLQIFNKKFCKYSDGKEVQLYFKQRTQYWSITKIFYKLKQSKQTLHISISYIHYLNLIKMKFHKTLIIRSKFNPGRSHYGNSINYNKACKNISLHLCNVCAHIYSKYSNKILMSYVQSVFNSMNSLLYSFSSKTKIEFQQNLHYSDLKSINEEFLNHSVVSFYCFFLTLNFLHSETIKHILTRT